MSVFNKNLDSICDQYMGCLADLEIFGVLPATFKAELKLKDNIIIYSGVEW
jgi:hypothetical protein